MTIRICLSFSIDHGDHRHEEKVATVDTGRLDLADMTVGDFCVRWLYPAVGNMLPTLKAEGHGCAPDRSTR